MTVNRLCAIVNLFTYIVGILQYERLKMTKKVYSVAGIATDRKGNTKVRYANNLDNRLKVLYRDKFTDINFIQLDNSLDKESICKLLLTHNLYINYVDVIHNELKRLSSINDTVVIKQQKRLRKLALANISAEDILEAIK